MPPPTVPGIPKSPSVPLNPCLITKFANRGIGTPHSTFNFKLTYAYYRVIIEDIRKLFEIVNENGEYLKK